MIFLGVGILMRSGRVLETPDHHLPHAPGLRHGAHDRNDSYHKKTERHSALPGASHTPGKELLCLHYLDVIS